MPQTLLERARTLHAAGQRAEVIEATLVGEGFARADVLVVLGALGLGPQPRPDPSGGTAPLALVTRVATSKVLVGSFAVAVMTLLGALLWAAAWLMAAYQRAR